MNISSEVVTYTLSKQEIDKIFDNIKPETHKASSTCSYNKMIRLKHQRERRGHKEYWYTKNKYY